MKKSLLVFLLFTFFYFFPLPILGANYSAENNPQYNLNIRTYDLLGTGRKQLVDEHDPGNYGKIPPQLCTMVAGNQFPDIPNLYQIHEYDFGNNRPSSGYVSVPDLLPDYSSLIGLSVMPGQNILVPNSGYDIGGGKQVMVLYASSDQITLRYAVQDDMSSAGYGIHLLGINTDTNLLNAYNQANSQGRGNLPALSGGEIVGTAAGNEILVSVRDSGSFMDPRWRNDWWFRCEDTHGIPFQGGTVSTQPGQPQGVFPSCTPNRSPDNIDSRPYWPSCNACGVGPTTSSCATSFNVYDEITYYKDDGALCSIDGQHWLEKDWGGKVTLNPKETTIPFVGKKGAEDEIKYLADYFEGTNDYYRKYFDGSFYSLDWVNYAGINRKLLPANYQDQLKVAMIQRASKSVAQTTTQQVIHDYEVKYNTHVCYDLPVITDYAFSAFIIFLNSVGLPTPSSVNDAGKYLHYCFYAYDEGDFPSNDPLRRLKSVLSLARVNWVGNGASIFNALPFPMKIKLTYAPARWEGIPVISDWIPFLGGPAYITSTSSTRKLTDFLPNLPPNPNDKDYIQKYDAWKKKDFGVWYRLWAAIPLASREDSKGDIVPILGAGQKDTFTVNQDSTIDYVPHVERLSELGKIAQKTLVPAVNKILGIKTESSSTQKENDNSVLADQTILLAQGTPASLDLTLNIPGQTVPGNYQMDVIGKVNVGPNCGAVCDVGNFSVSYNKGGGCPLSMPLFGSDTCASSRDWSINGMGGCGSPMVFMNYGDVYSITVVVDGYNAFNCGGPTDYKFPLSASCYMKLLAATATTPAKWETNCGAATPPAPPICGLVQPKGVPACDKSSITDSNPNDTLCCTEVTAKLDAKESFANADWSDCKIIVNGIEVRDPDCDTPLNKQVSRGIAVSLSQPYLKQIWDETANPKSGVFNLFRPASIPKFEPLDASSTIKYEYVGDDSSPAGEDPGSGTFYYPYLGGIQQAKNWLIKTLSPYPFVN